MPIYEFKCLKCEEFFELLIVNMDEAIEMCCPKCKSEKLEKIMSKTSHFIASGSESTDYSSQTRTCSSGNCTTYDIPGPTR